MQHLLTSGVSSPKDARDAPAVTDVPGGADRHGVHHPNASPRLHTPPPMPVPAGRHRRLDQTPDRYPGALELDARPDGLVADDSRWTTEFISLSVWYDA